MRGVKFEDLAAIVDFLYLGEANINQERIDNFLALAEELKLKGLTGNDCTKDKKENLKKPSSQQTKLKGGPSFETLTQPKNSTFVTDTSSEKNHCCHELHR